jgi:hypothetical protein
MNESPRAPRAQRGPGAWAAWAAWAAWREPRVAFFFLTKDHTRTSRVTCDTMHAKPRTRDAHNNTHTQPSHSHTP